MTFVDTADVYGRGSVEELIAPAVQARRNEIVLASKIGLPMSDDPADRGLAPERIRPAVTASLRRLGVDCLDLEQCHRPDPTVALEETLGASAELLDEGPIAKIGSSCFRADAARQRRRPARTVLAPDRPRVGSMPWRSPPVRPCHPDSNRIGDEPSRPVVVRAGRSCRTASGDPSTRVSEEDTIITTAFLHQPVAPGQTILWAINWRDDIVDGRCTAAETTAFQEVVGDEDRVVLERITPTGLPLDVTVEVHTRADAPTLAIRRVLADLIGPPPAQSVS